MRNARGLTEFEKNLRDEIYERDQHIGNDVKYAIDNGEDYTVPKNAPDWQKKAIENYATAHREKEEIINNLQKTALVKNNTSNSTQNKSVSYAPYRTNNRLDEYLNTINKKSETKEATSRNATFWDLTVNSLKRGYVQSLYGQESYKAMTGQKNNKAYYEKKLNSEDYSFIPDAWYEKALSGAMELLGQQVKQWTDPRSLKAGTTAATATAIAGQLGPQVAIPEEIFTVPSAFFAGISAGSAASNFEIEAGLAYNEMIENGVSHETARNIALGVGAGNAALEMVQLDDLIKSFKVLNVNDATKPTAKKILSYLKDRGTNVISETAQEVAQETVTTTGANIANKIDKGEWAYNWGEIGQRIGETAISSAMSFGLLGTGGDVINYGINKGANAIVNKHNNSVVSAKAIPANAKIVTDTTTNNTVATEQNTDFESIDNTIYKNNVSTTTTPSKTRVSEHVKSNLSNTVSVGDIFKDTKTGNTVKILSRNADKSNIEIDYGSQKIQRTVNTSEADALNIHPRYENINKVKQTENRTAANDVKEPTIENQVKNAVSVGDVFKDTKTGNTVTVLERDVERTTVEIDTGSKKETRTFTNNQADNLAVQNQFEPIKTELVSTKNITLTRMGDFYEAFGDEATELANKLNLTPTYKTVNGIKTAMVGFPVHVLERYQNNLGNDYNLIISDNADTVFTNDTAVQSQNFGRTVAPEVEAVQSSDDISAYENENADAQKMYKTMEDLGLTYDEQRAILNYKSSESYILNVDLRRGNELSKTQEKFKTDLESAMDKFPQYKGVVYRNIGFQTRKKFDAFIDEHINKTKITYPAFTSASKSIDGYVVNTLYTVHYEIESLNGRDIANIGIEEEKEILFKTNTTFEFSIIQQTDNHIFLKMKEVTENGKSKPYGVLEDRGERPTVGRNASKIENSRELERIYTGTDTFRGRSSIYDEVHNGTPNSNGGRIERGNQSQNLGSDTENGNDSRREGLLYRINSNNLTDKCELIATKHTATGNDIWVVTLKDRLSQEEYKKLSDRVKAVGGYYSRFAKTPDGKAIPGFVFKTEPTDKELSVFNDFFNETKADETLQTKSNKIISDDIEIENTEPKTEINAEDKKRLYDVYRRMKDRCYNSNAKDYKYYGEKGVKVNTDWLNSFDTFLDWALTAGYKKGLTIDRINPDGNYEPSNCRWVTMAEQNRNKSNSKVTDENQNSTELKDKEVEKNFKQSENDKIAAVRVTDENDSDVIDHTKGVEGLKLIDAEKSTSFNGKTLVTGIFELNSDKDFNRKSYKKEKFNIMLIRPPYVESVTGTTYGRYGISGNKTEGYTITYLPVGVAIAKSDTQTKAKATLEALENALPELPLTLKAFGDGYRYYGKDKEITEKVKSIIASATEQADKITLPLKNKKELISYLKNCVGNKIGVTLNDGTEEIRTVISASDTAIVTEQADGERSYLRAKAGELSYTDDGFVYTGANGVTVAYRFMDMDTDNDTINAKSEESAENVHNRVLDKESGNYSIESEDFTNEQTRGGILFGNGERGYNESSREQAGKVSSFKRETKGKSQAERKAFARELFAKKQTEEKIDGTHKYNLIKAEAYNDDMLSIVKEAENHGKEVGFFVGNAIRKFDGKRNFKIDGIKISDTKILVRYDGKYSPQSLLKHEIIHTEWDNPEIQRAREIILEDLSESEKEQILQNGRYKEYMELYEGDEDAVWEEFIADTFADMNGYTDDYVDIAADYWYNDNIADRYNPSEYSKTIDAGGNEYSLSDNGFDIPYNEKRQLDDYVLRKNFSDKKLRKIDCKEIGDNFYVWENESKTDYTVVDMIEIDGNEDLISILRKDALNGSFRTRESVRKVVAQYNGRFGSGNRSSVDDTRRKKTSGNGSVVGGVRADNGRGNITKSGGNKETKYALTSEELDNLEDIDLIKRWENAIENYGTIPKGEFPARDIDIPKKISDTIHSSKDVNDVSRWTTEKANNVENKGVNIADIVESIRDKFGIPIATGKVTDRQASGIYKDKPETIRTRIANNLPAISHELGHHLDKKYDLSKLESIKELRKVVSEEFLKQYPANDKNSEAVAEFVRIYLQNINDASRLCPDFYSDFISTLSKEDLKSLDEIASSVNEYLSYNFSERYDAAIVSSQKKEKLSFRDKWHKWYSDWVDAFHPQKQAVDYVEDVTGQTLSGKNNAYILATNSLNAHTVANFLICEGFRDLDGNIVDAKSFVESIGMVDSKDVKLLDKYLVLRHSLEWIAPEQEDVTAKRVFADDTLENVEEIKKQIAEIEKAHPEIKTAAENLYEYQNNVIKYFVIPAGGMTEDTLSTLNRKYPSYVPFYRAAGKKSGFAKGTFANQRSPIIRAKGSGALIISPTESIIRNTEKMVKFAMRNQVMSMWADYADTVDGFGQYMEKVTPDMLPHTINITTQKERFADALQQVVHSGEDYFAVSDLFDEIFGDAVSDFTPIANANKKIVTVLKDGKPSYYQIHDDAFYNSVAELSPQQTSGLLRIMNDVMQPMKLLITQNNPIFTATNAIRDYGTAYKLSEINNPVTFATQYMWSLYNVATNSDFYKQYKAMGGGHSSELSANIESISKTLRRVAQKDMGKARRLAYSIFLHPVGTVAAINDAVESTPRFMEFMRTLGNGGDLQQAIYNADDLTTNFKRSGKGSTAKAVNKTIMFNNAAIQGVDKMFRTLFTKDPKKRNKTLIKWALHALLMGVIGYIYNKEVDEEGYKNLSSYKKNNFYNYAIGDGKFISLPKPRENAVLDTFTERTIEYLFGDNENAFYDFGSYVSSQLLPPMLPDTLDPVDAVHSVMGSTVLGGLTDVGFNQDFKGTPIEGEYEKYSPSNERYTESTTKLAYGLGQTKLARELDMSPKKIDHIISSYTGILGQVNKALFPMNDSRRDTSIGLRNKFVSDSNYSTDVLNRMYENQEKAEKAFNYSGSVSDAVEYEKNSIITSYISGMNKAVKALPEDEQRNGRVYLLKALNSWNYENTTSQLSMLKCLDGSAVSKDVIFTELPSSSLEWTVNKQKYIYQMTPQEYHKYISDYMAIIENSRRLYGCNSVESCEKAKKATKYYMSKYKNSVLKRQYLNKATQKAE